jgi:probable phosphoglycerate mutase
MEKHVYLVRHGETDSNSDGVLRGPASMLTEKGKEQARVVAERIAKVGVDALVASTYQRALDTAGAIAEKTGLPVESSDLFIEWRQPSMTLNRHHAEPEVIEAHKEIEAGRFVPGYRHSDEESFEDFRDRAQKALSFLEAHSASNLCVVTHGITLRMIIGTLIFGDAFAPPHLAQLMGHTGTNNTGITYLRFGTNKEFTTMPPSWRIITWNDSAHLG